VIAPVPGACAFTAGGANSANAIAQLAAIKTRPTKLFTEPPCSRADWFRGDAVNMERDVKLRAVLSRHRIVNSMQRLCCTCEHSVICP
jgi:hypothetical protein